jgi:hypothetical protein
MGDWSLAVSGFTGDVERIKEIVSDLRAVFSKSEYGAGYASFSHEGVTVNNLHVPAEAPAAEGQGGSEPPAPGSAPAGPGPDAHDPAQSPTPGGAGGGEASGLTAPE